MSGLTRRVRTERDLWSAMWQQVETFLDRVESVAEQDAPHVRAIAVLLPALGVVERARRRALGYGLGPALDAAPRGLGRPPLGGLGFDAQRLPGVEECELAVAPYGLPAGASSPVLGLDPPIVLQPSVVLATFRDEERAADVQLVVPAYDFGRLTGAAIMLGVAKQGLFPIDQRQKAIDGASNFTLIKWSAVRNARVDALRTAYDAATSAPIAEAFAALDHTATLAMYRVIGARAVAAAGTCRDDRAILATAQATLADEGASDRMLGALAAARDMLLRAAQHYDAAAAELTTRTVGELRNQRTSLLAHLRAADQPSGPGVPAELLVVDSEAAAVLDVEVESRIVYPDGPLRMLRMLEQTLRWFWMARSTWSTRRHALLTRPLLQRFFAPFVDSLARVRAGDDSGVVIAGGTKLAAIAHVGGRDVWLTSAVPPVAPPAGRLLYVGGDRPTAAVVIDALDGGKRLATMPLAISLAAGAALPGLPGLLAAGAPVGGDFPTITDAEWRRGLSRSGRHADGLLEALVAHGTRLAVVLGGPGANKDRPDAPSLPAPYPTLDHVALEGPVESSATRLFATAIPPASSSGTGEALPIARPGELLLLRGADAHDQFWQTVVEVDRAEIVSGAEARADDSISDTATPPCCADDAPVMIVHVRSLTMPTAVVLTRAIQLRRDFRGFGVRSLLARGVLPEQLDPHTATLTVPDGSATRTVLRDAELKVAVRIFEDWLGTDAVPP